MIIHATKDTVWWKNLSAATDEKALFKDKVYFKVGTTDYSAALTDMAGCNVKITYRFEPRDRTHTRYALGEEKELMILVMKWS